MYCNICASDYEFINFLNTFIAENGLSVYDPINKLWLRRIDEKVNAKSSFIYNIAVYKMEDTTKIPAYNTENTKKKPTHFERFLSVHKYSETDSKIYCGVISCVNDDKLTQKMFLKLKRKTSKNFEKGMKWLDENLNVNPNSVLNSYFWSTSLDRDKKYYSSGNGVNQITPF